MTIPPSQNHQQRLHNQDDSSVGSTESFSRARPPQYNNTNSPQSELSQAKAGLHEQMEGIKLSLDDRDDDFEHVDLTSLTSGETTPSDGTLCRGPSGGPPHRASHDLFPLKRENLDVLGVVERERPAVASVHEWLNRGQYNPGLALAQFQNYETSQGAKRPASKASYFSDKSSWVPVQFPSSDSMDVSGAGARFDDDIIPTNTAWDLGL